MRIVSKTLIFLTMAASLSAQTWPSAAVPDMDAGLPGPPEGSISLQVGGSSLKSELWSEQKTKFSMTLGLGGGIGLSVAGSSRDLSGYGAFQRGLEDTRLGFSFWPALSERLALGVNGYFIVPTGFRTQELYYDTVADSMRMMPSFSLGQTGGELMFGGSWALAPIAELNGSAGYFSTSDQTQQAFRWGMGAWLAPLGPRYAAELGYGQSQTRAGSLPNTEMFSAALALKVGWGFTIVPGMNAYLTDDPLYGGSLGLRFTAPVPAAAVFAPRGREAIPIIKLGGRVIVPPPLASVPLADRDELWKSIREELHDSFDDVATIPTLDVPGLPYNDGNRQQQDQSLRAIAQAHPEADWLLLSRLEREDVSQDGSVSVPLLVSRKQWTAECRVTFELVNLRDIQSRKRETVDARAVKKEMPALAVVSSPESDVLSMSASRDLTFKAYREAGREIARELGHAE